MRLLIFLLVVAHSLMANESPVSSDHFKPSFDYSERALRFINIFHSKQKISAQRLEEWDEQVKAYVEKEPKDFAKYTRLITYLYAAQKDFAFLSLQMKGEMQGSIDPVSFYIIRMFYPFFRFKKSLNVDPYSILLASLVFKKYKERFDLEMEKEKDFRNFATQNWEGYDLKYGARILNWIPWKISLITIKTVNPPPDSEVEWANQLGSVKLEMQNSNEERAKLLNAWGNFYVTGWIDLMNNYLFTRSIPLEKIIEVRSTTTQAIYDALNFAFEVKYTYFIKPPYLADKSIKPKITIEHVYPSYPSAQVTVSEVAALVLSFFFPEEKKKWENIAEQNAKVRMWSGVNYPLDIEEGRRIARIISNEYVPENPTSKGKSPHPALEK